MDPATPELETVIHSLSQNQDLANNHIYQWINKSTDTVLKNNPQRRPNVIKKTWSKAVNNGKPKTVKNLQQLLDILLLELLQSDTEIFSTIEAQPESSFQTLNTWNDLIIAHYLQTLYNENEHRPIVFIGDITAIRRGIIESILNHQGIATTNCIKTISIDESIKAAKQLRIDNGDFETPLEAPSPPEFKHPIYLIGECHGQKIDTLFLGTVIRAEQRGYLIHGRECRFYSEGKAISEQNTHGLEGELASTLCHLHNAVVRLSLIDFFPMEETLNIVSLAFASIASASDPLLLKAIDSVHQKENWALSWLINNQEKLLKKDFKNQCKAIEKSFEGTLKAKKEKHIDSLKSVLKLLMKSILEVQKELPDHQQLSEEQLRILSTNKKEKLPTLAQWRDTFIAENIVKLHTKAESKNIPLIIILGAAHIENIRNKLEEQGIPTSSNVIDLPLEGPGESSKLKAFNQWIKEEKQKRIESKLGTELEQVETALKSLEIFQAAGGKLPGL